MIYYKLIQGYTSLNMKFPVLLSTLLLTMITTLVMATPAFALNDYTAEYFNNLSLSGTAPVTRTETQINHNWESGSPDQFIFADNFSARWTGDFDITQGTYRFTTTADDGVRLFVDGVKVIDRWIDQPPTTYSVTLDLDAGQHEIILEYYEKGGGATAVLFWEEVLPENPAAQRIMPLGDSITHGWNVPGGYRMKLAQLISDMNFVGTQQNGPSYLTDKDHEGYPGWKVQQLNDTISASLNVYDSEIILLKIGTNDMGSDADWSLAAGRLQNLLTTITNQTDAHVVVATLIPFSDSIRNQRAIQYNEQLPGIVQSFRDQGKNVHLVDMYAALTILDLADGIHPNLAGYEKMAQVWANAITQLRNGEIPELPNKPDPEPTPEVSTEYYSGEFFNNLTMSGTPVWTITSQTIANVWGSGSPHATVTVDNFSSRWQRMLGLETGTYRFTVTADDGIRVKLGNQTIINQWVDQAPTTYTVDIEVTEGQHLISIEYYEKGGGATAIFQYELLDTPQPSPSTSPSPQPTPEPPLEPGTGYEAEYFSNLSLTGTPALVREDSAIDFIWNSGSPHPSLPVDNFSARWTRAIEFEAGTYRFSATGDDGLRVFVDGALILNQWKDQPPTNYSVEKTLTEGIHQIKVEYYEKGGGATMQFGIELITLTEPEPTTSPEPTVSPTPQPPVEPTEGFQGVYFNNMNLSGTPALNRVDGAIDFDWVAGSPHPSIGVDNFSVRWSKQHFFEPGVYRFSMSGDDGVRLKIDGQMVIDQWKDQPPTTYTVDLSLSAGTHAVVMEYYEKGAGAVARLGWQKIGELPSEPEPSTEPNPLPTDTFQASYFNNMSLSGNPAWTTTQSEVNFDWILGSPHESIGIDHFSARWQRLLQLEAGTYRFTVTADDGFRLKIGDQTILDRWIDQAPTTYSADFITTQQSLPLTLEYYEKGAGAIIQMNWQKIQ